jgi:oxygen-dependent protoporphyrinogen oxidase
MPSDKKVAVIGAGIAGLSCAYELKKAGLDVVVIEKESFVGGRMAGRKKDGLMFDIGADHLCNLYYHMREYCEELGIPWQKMEFLKYGLFKDGEVVRPTKAISAMAKLRLTLQYLKRRKVKDFFDLTHAAHYDTENAREYMDKKIGKNATDYLVDSFTSTYQFHGAEDISLGALLGILGSVKNDQKEWYLHRTKGGMSALPEALAAKLKVHLGESVQEIIPGDTVHVKTDKGEYDFDALVLATTADAGAKILKDPTPAQHNVLSNTLYSTTISVALRVDKSKLPDVSIVWVPKVQSPTVSGYVNESMKGEEVLKDGKTLVSIWLHEDFAKTIIDKSDDEIFEAVKPEFLKVCPWFSDLSELDGFDLHRWYSAMPKYNQGSLKRICEFLGEGHQGENNIYLAGDYMNSPWTEGSLRCGKRTASDLLEGL